MARPESAIKLERLAEKNVRFALERNSSQEGGWSRLDGGLVKEQNEAPDDYHRGGSSLVRVEAHDSLIGIGSWIRGSSRLYSSEA